MHQYLLGDTQLESSRADVWGHGGPQVDQFGDSKAHGGAEKANCIPGCSRQGVGSRRREVILPGRQALLHQASMPAVSRCQRKDVLMYCLYLAWLVRLLNTGRVCACSREMFVCLFQELVLS